LIGIIVLVIAVSSCVALSIKQSGQSQQEGLNQSISPPKLRIDRSALIGQFNEFGQRRPGSFRQQLGAVSGLSLDELKIYAAAPRIGFLLHRHRSVNREMRPRAFTTETTESECTESQPNTGGMTFPEGMPGMTVDGVFRGSSARRAISASPLHSNRP
jgi:putative ABC transport system permease protein